MTTVMFKGRTPLTNPIHIGVLGDNLSETVSFVLDDLPEGLVYLKLDYDGVADKLLLKTQENTASWLVEGAALRHSGRIFAQLQIENGDGVVWQSEAFVLNCSPAIDADKQIERTYPSILTTHELRISQLEQNGGGGEGGQGSQGERGEKGDRGDDGAQGPQGERGEKGERGDDGAQGPQGERGEKGDRGDDGAQGPQGEKGEKGDRGDNGAQGLQGERGEKGDRGDDGAQGLQGEQGEKGDRGDDGAQGPQGEKGEKGDDGLTTSVNGIAQIGGEVSISAEDIPYTCPEGVLSTGAALDAHSITLNGAPIVHIGNPVSFLAGENRIESIYLRGNSIQAGSGEASPENIRPIVGTSPVITINGTEYSLSDAGEIHGQNGVFDEIDSSGLEIRRNKLFVFDGSENWLSTTSAVEGKLRAQFRDPALLRATTKSDIPGGICSHFVARSFDDSFEGAIGFSFSASTTVSLYFYYPDVCDSVESFVAWVKAQYDAGTPLTMVLPCTAAAITEIERAPLILPNPQGFVTISAGGEVEVRLGTLALKSDIKNITVSPDEPSGGKNGDIYFRNMGSSIRTYVKIENTWIG